MLSSSSIIVVFVFVFRAFTQTALTAELKEIEAAVAEKQKEVDFIERNKTWNWENMCHVTEERTIINKSAASEVRKRIWIKGQGGREEKYRPDSLSTVGAAKEIISGYPVR